MQTKMTQKIIAILIFWLFSMSSFATQPPLPADQAFAFSATFSRTNEVLIQFQIAPSYYLYAKRLYITLSPNIPAIIHVPQGEFKVDNDNKRYEAYSGKLVIPIQFQAKPSAVDLMVDYQGCSQAGFCYPPMQKQITLNLLTKTIQTAKGPTTPIASFTALMTDQNDVRTWLQNYPVSMMLVIFLGLGLLLAFTPCVLPMIPILTSIIVGQKKISTKKAFFLSLTYVLGTAITYAFAGLLAVGLGHSLQVWLQKPWLIALSSGLFALLALSLFDLYHLRFPYRLQHRMAQLTHRPRGGTYVGVFCMGILSTLIVSPCVTAPLVGVLMYVSETGNLLFATSALFMLGIGMGLPLLLIGMSAGKWLPKQGPWMEAVKKVVGILMLGMAVWLLSRIVSPAIINLVWGIWLLGIAIFFIVYLPRYIGKQIINRGLGFLFGCLSLMLISGIYPVNIFNQEMPSRSFIVVHSISDLDKQLSLAQAKRQPVILDFYADWCESCISMDRNVFALTDVQKVLTNYVLLRADLSANSSDDEALLKKFAVIAPPTVLLFNAEGKEESAHRIVGEVNATEFLTRLNLANPESCNNIKC